MSTRWIWRVVDVLVAAIFIYAGALKVLDPVGFARDVDNYKMLPWPAAVALGLYLPWLEIVCGLAILIRRLYRGSLVILTALAAVFIVASVIAKARGLDISCGCFGHVSKGWSFGWHLLLDFGILGILIVLWFTSRFDAKAEQAPSHRDGLKL
jgi:putative oxidoreductase